MKKESTPLHDLLLLHPVVHGDHRGYFTETYNQKTAASLDLPFSWVQDNESLSMRGTFRGLHFQKPPFSQAKLIRVVRGAILDIVVDLRESSATYGKSFSVELSQTNHLQLLVPRGFAHGFLVLADDTIVNYKCDNFFNKESEGGLSVFDATVTAVWPKTFDRNDLILSEKDKHYGNLNSLRGIF